MKFIRRNASDAERLFVAELIVGEILANTVEHAPGLVEVRIDWHGEHPVVSVLDTGPGLAEVLSVLPEDGK
jgi:anti-sigma regulatory factor (Ser/Thr protein kinase)